jgi:CHAT domain-containing protein
LSTAGSEVSALAQRYPEAKLLRDADATVESSLGAIDGAALAYIAAHGRHRSDSPMFSCLDLADGPLTVHDFEQLHAAPYRLLLSACDSGVMAAVGADELLGLASALFSVGTAGIVSSVAEVNDEATAHVMLDVHSRVWAGDALGEVLLRARTEASGDLVHEATAASFIALGV